MDGYDGLAEYQVETALIQESEQHLEAMRAAGHKLAEKERLFRRELAKKVLVLKHDGIPATLIKDVARGDAEISELEFAMKCAETDFNVERELSQLKKKQATFLHEERSREYYSPQGGF